jgi:putative endonuclease
MPAPSRIADWFALRAARRSTRHLGRAGEVLAARAMRRSGHAVIGRNLRVPMGEADLLCLGPDRLTIVLVEVKTREIATDAAAAFLPPEASITADKRHKLRAILRHLCRANRWGGRPCRIDVVAVDWPAVGRPVVRHHVGAVQP